MHITGGLWFVILLCGWIVIWCTHRMYLGFRVFQPELAWGGIGGAMIGVLLPFTLLAVVAIILAYKVHRHVIWPVAGMMTWCAGATFLHYHYVRFELFGYYMYGTISKIITPNLLLIWLGLTTVAFLYLLRLRLKRLVL